MSYNAHDSYLESRILSADPVELVGLMYQAASGAVREARQHLAEGEIAGRSRSITKAYEILAELASALDHERGGEISTRLAQLYDYMQRKLLEANLQQIDPPLAEVLGLLATLSEAWEAVKKQVKSAEPAPAPAPAPVPAGSPWAQPVPGEPASAYAPQAWSL